DRAAVCHARSYDAAHLAKHPSQKVAAISLQMLELLDKGGDEEVSLRLKLSARLRDGKTASRVAICFASAYAFNCNAETSDEAASGEGWAFYLQRAGDRGITIRDHFADAKSDASSIGRLLHLPLGNDDRTFRLDERDDPACDAR